MVKKEKVFINNLINKKWKKYKSYPQINRKVGKNEKVFKYCFNYFHNYN